MNVHMSKTWNDDRVVLLKDRWAAGFSVGVIAEELGVTKNTVIGKLDRMGLIGKDDKRKAPISAQTKVRNPLSTNFAWDNSAHMSQIINRLKTFHPPPEPEVEMPAEQRKSIFELNDHTCKWPVGDPQSPDFFFCGAPVYERPYCEAHRKVAYRCEEI